MNDIMIRTANEADAPELLKIYAPYVENTVISFETEVHGTIWCGWKSCCASIRKHRAPSYRFPSSAAKP